MRLHRIALGAVVAATLALTGCGATKDKGTDDASTGSAGAGKAATGLQYMVPNAPGGGYDFGVFDASGNPLPPIEKGHELVPPNVTESSVLRFGGRVTCS